MLKLLFAVIFVSVIVNAIQIDKNHLLLYLYSPSNNNVSISVPLNRSEFNSAKLNTSSDMKVIIHGYGTDAKHPLHQSFIDSYFKTGEHNNIIFFDWNKYCSNYFQTFSWKEQIADIITEDLLNFAKENNITLTQIHMIGISFGAQLAGLIGQRVFSKTGTKLTRITGLDPAGPLFLGAQESSRLDPSDAIFVDVIHTYLFTGYFQSCGTIDFFPNGGQFQRGCDVFSLCSHVRATEYYIESINSRNFSAWECYSEHLFNQGLCEEGDCVAMGEHVNTSATGHYFLHTHPQSPYSCNC